MTTFIYTKCTQQFLTTEEIERIVRAVCEEQTPLIEEHSLKNIEEKSLFLLTPAHRLGPFSDEGHGSRAEEEACVG